MAASSQLTTNWPLPLYYSLSTDHKENTASTSSFIVVCIFVAADMHLLSGYQTMAVFFCHYLTIGVHKNITRIQSNTAEGHLHLTHPSIY
jgi:hypothetical protein